jgi:hypothetical protein
MDFYLVDPDPEPALQKTPNCPPRRHNADFVILETLNSAGLHTITYQFLSSLLLEFLFFLILLSHSLCFHPVPRTFLFLFLCF